MAEAWGITQRVVDVLRKLLDSLDTCHHPDAGKILITTPTLCPLLLVHQYPYFVSALPFLLCTISIQCPNCLCQFIYLEPCVSVGLGTLQASPLPTNTMPVLKDALLVDMASGKLW